MLSAVLGLSGLGMSVRSNWLIVFFNYLVALLIF